MRCGTEEQRARWLVPLLEGKAHSCFAMTEPQLPPPGLLIRPDPRRAHGLCRTWNAGPLQSLSRVHPHPGCLTRRYQH